MTSMDVSNSNALSHQQATDVATDLLSSIPTEVASRCRLIPGTTKLQDVPLDVRCITLTMAPDTFGEKMTIQIGYKDPSTGENEPLILRSPELFQRHAIFNPSSPKFGANFGLRFPQPSLRSPEQVRFMETARVIHIRLMQLFTDLALQDENLYKDLPAIHGLLNDPMQCADTVSNMLQPFVYTNKYDQLSMNLCVPFNKTTGAVERCQIAQYDSNWTFQSQLTRVLNVAGPNHVRSVFFLNSLSIKEGFVYITKSLAGAFVKPVPTATDLMNTNIPNFSFMFK